MNKDTGSDKRNKFFMIDNRVVRNYGLTPHQGWLYAVIVYHLDRKENDAFPSIATLAKESGMSKPSAIKAIQHLEQVGLIRVTRTTTEKGDNAVNHYALMDAITLAQVGRRPSSMGGVVNDVNQGGKPGLPGVVNDVDHNNTHSNKTQEQDLRPNGRTASGEPQKPKPQTLPEPSPEELDAFKEIDAAIGELFDEPESPKRERPAVNLSLQSDPDHSCSSLAFIDGKYYCQQCGRRWYDEGCENLPDTPDYCVERGAFFYSGGMHEVPDPEQESVMLEWKTGLCMDCLEKKLRQDKDSHEPEPPSGQGDMPEHNPMLYLTHPEVLEVPPDADMSVTTEDLEFERYGISKPPAEEPFICPACGPAPFELIDGVKHCLTCKAKAQLRQEEEEREQAKAEPVTKELTDQEAIVGIIAAWLDSTGTIDPKAYAKKGLRDIALAMHKRGVTPELIAEYVEWKHGDKFWIGQDITLYKIANTIIAWRDNRFIHPADVPWTPPVDPDDGLTEEELDAKYPYRHTIMALNEQMADAFQPPDMTDVEAFDV